MEWKVEVMHTGYCTSHQNMVLRGTPKITIKFYAVIALLHHPKYGYVLFDTGYSDAFYRNTKRLPNKLYAKVTPVFHVEGQSAKSRLKALGVSPGQVRTIVISHFHADHISGLEDFPESQFLATEKAWKEVRGKKGINAVRRGFIPEMIPADFESRLTLLGEKDFSVPHPILDMQHDLFGDGSLLACTLPGHAAGQLGLRVNAGTENEIFFCADAAWVLENIEQLHLPSPLVRTFFHSWSDFAESLRRLNAFHKSKPEVKIVPTHCEQTLRGFLGNEI
jgi:glyoxylase-like metal-dependent hydrolase (beta-lactamase superfamily II)